MRDSVTRRAVTAISWTSFGTVLSAALQVVFSSVLARLLAPSDFGLVAMAGAVLHFGTYFTRMGLGSALVQKNTITGSHANVAFSLSALLSLVYVGVMWAIAPWGSVLFGTKQLTEVIRAMTLTYVLADLSTTPLALLQRKMQFRSVVLTNLLSYTVGYGGVGILLAWLGYGVWSLVLCTLVQRALALAMSLLLCHHPFRLEFNCRVSKGLVSFGGLVSVISIVEFLSTRLDVFVIGYLMDATRLGIYDRAFLLVQLPTQYIFASLAGVLLPTFSRLQSDLLQLRDVFQKYTLLFGAVVTSASFGMIPAAREMVLVILGEKWVATVPLVQLFAFSVPFAFLSALAGVLWESQAELLPKLFLQLVSLSLLGLLFYLLMGFGLAGFASAVALTELVRFAAYLLLTKRLIKTNAVTFGRIYGFILTSGIVTSLGIYAVSIGARTVWESALPTFILQLLTGILVLAGITLGKWGPLQMRASSNPLTTIVSYLSDSR